MLRSIPVLLPDTDSSQREPAYDTPMHIGAASGREHNDSSGPLDQDLSEVAVNRQEIDVPPPGLSRIDAMVPEKRACTVF